MGSVIGSYLSNGPLNLKPSTWRDGGRFGEIFLEFDMNVRIFWLVMALIVPVFVLFKRISTPPHSFFGHFSHRSEWQLIKIDYKSLYSRKCTEEDYQTWHLHNQVGKKQRHCSTRRERGRCWLTTGFPAGRAVRDGTEADLHEAQARELLHAGKGLLQNPVSRVLHLPSSWFRMVRRQPAIPLTAIGGDYVFLHCLWNGRLINDDACLTALPHWWTRSFQLRFFLLNFSIW